MIKRLAVMLTCLAVYGCAGSPARIAMLSPEELRSEDSSNLCNAYASGRSENVRSELERRGDITDEEWVLIEEKKIRIGMSELALICSWGAPGVYGSINKSVGSWGIHKQWVYRACSSCRAQYVYTENGRVRSWQN